MTSRIAILCGTTRYEYHTGLHLVSRHINPDGREIQFSYDQYGQLTQVDDGAWPLTFEYNAAGNLLAEHQGWASSYFKHDAMGRLAHWQLPDGNKLAYHYLNGELSGIDLNGAELTRHQMVSGLEMRRSQGALTQQYEYDEQGRLTALRLQRGKQVARERRFGYDCTGNLLQINDSVQGEQHYRYDPLDRLLEVRGELTERFLHDPAGNLLSQTLGGKFEGARTQGNRLLLSGDRHFEYDEFGRLAIERRGKGQSLVTRYHYDCQHQLVRAELADGTTANYDYDAFGRRIRKTVSRANSEQVTEFVWQANNLIAESSYQLGNDKRRTDEQYRSFIYEPGSFKPLVQLEGEGTDTEVFHYQLDHLGTPLALIHDNGVTAWQVRYRAYGNVWREEIADVATPLRFQGQYFDAETGLHYNRHRYYQPETGRFITPDPIGLAGGLNNYQYAPNPIGWVDPLGLHNEIGICPGLKEQLLKSDSASEWGTLNDGTNQGVKHFADYWEKFPERIPSLEQRLGLESGAFSPSVDGFKAFTDAAKKVVELSGANTKHLPDAKSIHYVPGKVKESKGVVVILRHGKLQSMMPSDLKSFGKMQ